VKIVLVLALSVLIACGLRMLKMGNELRANPPAAGVVPANSIFHKPLGADCPPGTDLLPNFFTERNGNKIDACHNPQGDGSIDYVNPGEGFEIRLPDLPSRREERKSSS
jgi:hypothetical protein